MARPRRGGGRAAAPLVAIAALATAVAALPAQLRSFALEDIAAFAAIGELAVSPDGRHLAFAVRRTILPENRTQTDVWTVPADGSVPPRQLTFDRAAERSLRWSPDSGRVAFLSDRDGSRQVWTLPLGGGEATRLTAHREAISAFEFSPDGRDVAFVAPALNSPDEERRERDGDDGYLLGEQWRNHRLWIGERPVTDGRFHVQALAWRPGGRQIAIVVTPTAEADAAEDARAQIVDMASGEAVDVPGSELAARLAWSPDGRWLAFTRAFDGRGISREDAHVWEAGTADRARNVSAALDRDVEDLSWADSRAVDLRVSSGVAGTIARATVAGGPVVVRPLEHPVGAWRRSARGHVFTRTDRPHEVYLADETGTRPITSFNAGASTIPLPTPAAVRWKGPAGEVEGVLFTPHGFDPARRYPLIVNPHGGPRSHSTLDFDSTVAYWTGLGYIVLRPNFRGSTGYGDAFTKANIEDWGDGPYQDVMAGVDALVLRGVADPGRLFMYGWSYGGILANWTATHTSRFKAIVSGASVADGRLQYAISDARRWRFDYFRGSPFLEANEELYRRESPITYARHAKTPTLFVVGERDTRCPPEQSLMMYRAFKDHGVTTELLVYPREDHTFVEPRHIVDRARRIAEWFRRFDPAAGPSRPTSSGS